MSREDDKPEGPVGPSGYPPPLRGANGPAGPQSVFDLRKLPDYDPARHDRVFVPPPDSREVLKALREYGKARKLEDGSEMTVEHRVGFWEAVKLVERLVEGQ